MDGVSVAFCWPPCLTAVGPAGAAAAQQQQQQQQTVDVCVCNQAPGQAIQMVVQASGRTLLDVTSFLPSPGFHTMRIVLDGSLQAAGHATVSVAPLGRPSRLQQATAPSVPLPVCPQPVAQELGMFFDSLVKARLRAATVRPSDTNRAVAEVYAAHVRPLLLDLTAVCAPDEDVQPFHELQLVCSRLVPYLNAEQLQAALGMVRHVLGRQDLPVDLLAPLAQPAGHMASGSQCSVQQRQRGIPYPQLEQSGVPSSSAQTQPAGARLTAQAVALASATAPASHNHLQQHMGGPLMHRRSRTWRPMLGSPEEDGPSGRRPYQAAMDDDSDDGSSDESVMLTTYVPAQLEPLAQDPFRPELMQGPDDQSDSDASGVLVDSIMRASCAADEDTLSYINSINSACIAALMHPSFDNHGSAYAAGAGTSNTMVPNPWAAKGSQLPSPQQPQQRHRLGEEPLSISGTLAAFGSRSGPPSDLVDLPEPAAAAVTTTVADHTQLVAQHLSPRTLVCGFSRGLEHHFLLWWCQQQQHADTTGMVAVLLVLAACAATDLFRSDLERTTSLAPMALLLLPHMATALLLCAMQAWGGPLRHARIGLARWMRVALEAMLLCSLPAQSQLSASLEQSLVARCLLHVLLHSMCRPVLLRSTPMLALAEFVPPSAMMLRGGTPISSVLLQQAAVWLVSCATAAAVEHHKRQCFLRLLSGQHTENGAGSSGSSGGSAAAGNREGALAEPVAAASTCRSAARTAAQALLMCLRNKQD